MHAAWAEARVFWFVEGAIVNGLLSVDEVSEEVDIRVFRNLQVNGIW
jgi:hypothetical protein